MITEQDFQEGKVELDFNNKTLKGYCKAKNFKAQIEKLKQEVE